MQRGWFLVIQLFFVSVIITINAQEGAIRTMKMTSKNFVDRGDIPKKHTCDGEDISPELSWTGAPEGVRSYVLIVDDPDAPDPASPKMTWVHWVLYNIPPSAVSLPEGVSKGALPKGTLEGVNDWKQPGYRGPCPPVGKHRYYHKLYALDTVMPDLGLPKKAKVLQAMEGHVITRAELVGFCQR